MTSNKDVDVIHTQYVPTGLPPLCCDVCGEVFGSYMPTFVGIYIPKDRESQTITLCQSCERDILEYLKITEIDE